MIGRAHLSTFPSQPPPRKRDSLRFVLWFFGLNIGLLFFSLWFWFSVLLRLGLGTDYFFDVFFANLSSSFLGNVVLIVGVIFCPGLAVGVNGMFYMTTRRPITLLFCILSAVLLIGGFFAAVRRG